MFAGDAADELAHSANLLQVVQPANSTPTLDSSKNPASPGDNLTFTVAVAGGGGTAGGSLLTLTANTGDTGTVPTGTVRFLDGSTLLGSAPVGVAA